MRAPICPYCGKNTRIVDGRHIYPGRQDLKKLKFWACLPCDAYVGCHKGTVIPLGTPANRKLREARSKAHAVFDPMWKDGPMSRDEAYAVLAREMKLEPDECHIALFSIAQCDQLVELMKEMNE